MLTSLPPFPFCARHTRAPQAAKKGYELLKKKADALKARFRDIAKRIEATKSQMSEACSGSFFSLTQVRHASCRHKLELTVSGLALTTRREKEEAMTAADGSGLRGRRWCSLWGCAPS